MRISKETGFMNKTVTVNAIGLVEKECRMIRNILSLASGKDQTYRLAMDSAEPADLVIVNADDAAAMSSCNEYRQIVPDANIVLASAAPFESDYICIKRPLIASQLHSVLALSEQPKTLAPRQNKYETLKNSFLFRSLSPAHLQKIIGLARTLMLPAHHLVFGQADGGDEMLVVLSGRLKISVTRQRDGGEITLGVLGPGELFGEIAMLDGRGRSASATTLTPCELLEIHRKDFMPFLEQNPKAALDLLTVLALRLRLNTDQLAELSIEQHASS